jgi:hypothetical protein
MYREVNTYAHLQKEYVPGNPDGSEPQELHQSAVELLTPIFESDWKVHAENYRRLAETNQASNELTEVLKAAHRSQIDTLLVPLDEQRWGRFNEESGQVQIHETRRTGDEDLLDLAAVRTHLNGGTVCVIPGDQMPEGTLVAAIFRFVTSA